MRALPRTIWIVPALVVAVTPALAQIDAGLAKTCRTLMIKAHPTEMYRPNGSAAAQRSYFDQCIRNQGAMPEASNGRDSRSPSTTGQGN